METNAREINLKWDGPFIFGKSKTNVLPPDEPGVYIWTIPTTQGHLLSNVGESSAILSRWSVHALNQLGGLYKIYDPILLRSGKCLKVIYECKNETTILTEFTKELINIAWENLNAYELFWATFPNDFPRKRSWRMAVESAIQNRIIGTKYDNMLWSHKKSISCTNAWRIRCICVWPEGLCINGLTDNGIIDYGEVNYN